MRHRSTFTDRPGTKCGSYTKPKSNERPNSGFRFTPAKVEPEVTAVVWLRPFCKVSFVAPAPTFWQALECAANCAEVSPIHGSVYGGALPPGPPNRSPIVGARKTSCT